ncbi:MAG: glycine cleavage system aminomethyltransferase GcvT [Chloroflexi bacterium]|nr:glycine cleavage system aminomethyltransferase GcvT [Chloroflexota bacterium]MCL5075603.1 glycine cleavage system aminomethyltransferase GcvT [Chloroflexota bacterium]
MLKTSIEALLEEDRDYASLLFKEDLSEIDSDTDLLIAFEEERQKQRLIMIPSESIAPKAVRQALGSVFTNIYAEGWPCLKMTRDEIDQLLEYEHQLAHHRRYADRRFYRGCEYVNLIEALAQKRVAELFATTKDPDAKVKVGAEEILANVQPLSGAAANNAVYEALLQPGDTVMGMSLTHGGHLTHGSEYNRSGKYYKIVPYGVSRRTGRLDYEEIRKLALEAKPRLIIAGASAYPWDIDWEELRQIADAIPDRAFLMADIAHPAGLVVARKFPNPIGYADVITFTTHKTMIGPRGAVILATVEEIAQKIDRAVFPGEQGGPHINNIAAMAVAFKIAQTQKFKRLQERIVANAQTLATTLQGLGLRLAYGGTNTHMLLIDLNGIETPGFPLKGDIASRILDMCGIVCNKNTIPGDTTAATSSAIRLGTVWLTQRGLREEQMEQVAELIHRVLTNIHPFRYIGASGDLGRGKIELPIMEEVRGEVASIVEETEREITQVTEHQPRHLVPEEPLKRTILFAEHQKRGAKMQPYWGWLMPLHYGNPEGELEAARTSAALFDLNDAGLLLINGERAKFFLQGVATSNVIRLEIGQCQPSLLLNRDGSVIDDVLILRLNPDKEGRDRYLMMTNAANTEGVKTWLRALSDGCILFDDVDLYRKIDGPVVIEDLRQSADEEWRRIALSLHGPKSMDVLHQVDSAVPDIGGFRFLETEIKGVEAIIVRNGYTNKDVRLDIFVRPDDAPKLWGLLLSDGAGVQPAGIMARDRLHSEVGLPSYDGAKVGIISLLKAGHDHRLDLSKPYFIGQRAIMTDTDLPARGVRAPSRKSRFTYSDEGGEPKPTCLYEEHLKLTSKRNIVTFAGWLMPVWYTSISEEHRAVRETAALFDISHMGVLDIQGENATRFLDLVTTNYVPTLGVGQSHYSYILDPEGKVMDDVFIYRLSRDGYMMVVNAVNAGKIKAWLDAVNSRQYLIDAADLNKEIEAVVTIKDLKDHRWGKECRIDMGLQGPNSLAILQQCLAHVETQKRLRKLRRSELMQTQIAGIEVIISRTGYTGEEMGYELYVNPAEAPTLWNLLLEKGRDYGLKPAGLGARDSTRTEAGFPLYGHELAGKYDISPTEAGYGAFVKLHKPFFIGKKPFMDKEARRKQEVVRFQMNAKGIRMVKPGDPVVNRKGECIGAVTSCVSIEGIQIGLAFVDRNYTAEGTRIGIFVLPREEAVSVEKTKRDLVPGDRVLLHEEATVISRFMMPKATFS